MYQPVFLRRLFLYASVLLLTQCSKCKDDPQPKDPVSQLPPATQEGKNTFGCLVNGRAFTPKGNIGGITQNLSFEYDPTFSGGTCSLETYYVISGKRENLILKIAPMSGIGTYSFDLPSNPGRIDYQNNQFTNSCAAPYTNTNITYQRGYLTFTRLDLTARIASGTFAVTFARPGCDTIRLTDGRFDVKF